MSVVEEICFIVFTFKKIPICLKASTSYSSMCPEKVKRDEGFEVVGGDEGGDNPQNDPGHHCPPLLPAYLGQTIFRGSLILRSGPDKDKDRRDGGVDRRSWG